MVISRSKCKRTITEKEFKRLKKLEPFSSYRQDSKGLNFGLLFGMSYRTYSATRLETNWSVERCEAFIDEHNLRDLKWEIAQIHKKDDPKLWSYYTVSKYFRDTFFKTYPELLHRIDERREEGRDNGYIRSLHGAVRHTLPLLLGGEEDNKKEEANLLNVCANTDIQNDEACRVMSSIVEFNDAMKRGGYKSRIIGTVHDSVDFYIHKTELKELYEKTIIPIFEKMEDWQTKICLAIDVTVVDLSKDGAYYKHGVDVSQIIKECK